MKDREAKTKIWREMLDTICESNSWGNRPCDDTGYCPYENTCSNEWFLREYAKKLKEAGLDYSYYKLMGFIED